MMKRHYKRYKYYFTGILLLVGVLFVRAQDLPDTSMYIPGAPNYNLLIASDLGYLEEVKRLVKAGANVDTETWDGVTPLMYAAQRGHNEIVNYLIEKGASVNRRPESGFTPLITATMFNHIPTAETLIQNGANIEARDENGLTPLLHAVANEFYFMADMLLYYNADVNAKDEDGNTPMMVTSLIGNKDLVDLLYNYGADVNLKDDDGYTPLMIAAQEGHKEIVEYLVYHGADISAESETGATALLLAVANQQVDVVSFLLDEGADPDPSIKGNINALSLANKVNNYTIKKILKEYGAKPDRKPSINKLGGGAFFDLNITDLMMGLNISAYEMKYAFSIDAGYEIRPFANRILAEDLNNNTFQFWEKRHYVYAGIKKQILNTNQSHFNTAGFSVNLRGIYTFGNYRGAIQRPDAKFIPGAGVGFFQWNYNRRFELGYEFQLLNVEGISNHKLVVGYTWYFSLPGRVLNEKRINWLNF